MHRNGKRNPIAFLLILSMLLLGMCFDNVQTDSFLACLEDAPADTGRPASALHPATGSAASEKAYVAEPFQPGNVAFAPRQALRKTGVRICRCSSFAAFVTDALPLLFPPASGSDSHIVFQEIISNTVILDYMHRQDGQKSAS